MTTFDYQPKNVLTREDVIRSGACASGVEDFCKRHKIVATALPVDVLLRFAKDDGEEGRVLRAANLDGYGNGNGYGNGYGNGDGYGNGNGYGNGYGNGDGDGDGYGDGYGDGDGDGGEQ